MRLMRYLVKFLLCITLCAGAYVDSDKISADVIKGLTSSFEPEAIAIPGFLQEVALEQGSLIIKIPLLRGSSYLSIGSVDNTTNKRVCMLMQGSARGFAGYDGVLGSCSQMLNLTGLRLLKADMCGILPEAAEYLAVNSVYFITDDCSRLKDLLSLPIPLKK